MEICRIARDKLGPKGSGQLRLVALAVGQEAPVETDNLTFCLDALLTQAPFGQARVAVRCCPGSDLGIDYLEIDDGDSDD